MSRETLQYCSRCGGAFRKGQTRYVVTIHIVADFDGHVNDEGSSLQPEQMWREIEQKTEEELINEVVQKISFVLCKPCRDAWSRSPLGMSGREGLSTASSVH